MSSGNSDRSKWKFDPNTGEPVADNTPDGGVPSERPSLQSAESYSAPITGPLEPAPQVVSDTDVDSFRAPYQEQSVEHTPIPTDTTSPPQSQSEAQAPQDARLQSQPEQAAYQQPTYTPATPAIPAQAPTQPYGYQPTQPPTQPVAAYAPPQVEQHSYDMGQTPPAQTQAAPPKRKSNTPLIAGIIALVVVAALGIGGFLFYQNVLNRPAVSVEKLLPASTLGYFTFDPVLEGDQKAAMDKIGEAFKSQPGFQAAWDKITSESASALSGTGCAEDTATPPASGFDALSTYLGNSITVAVLSPSSDDLQQLKDAANNGNIDTVGMDIAGKNIVGLVDLNFNPLNKKGLISDLKQQSQNITNAETVEKYRDIDIHKFTPKECGNSAQNSSPQSVYYALLDNSATAIVAIKTGPLHVVIDSYRDNKSLKDNETFKALSGQVPQNRIAALYLNLTDIYKQVQLAVPELTKDQSIQNVSGAMLLTLSAANDGLQIDTATETDASVMGAQVQVNPNARPDQATLNDVPAGTLGFLAGTDLQTLLKQALDNVRKTGKNGDIDQQIQNFEQQFNISLENDVLPLLGGDYALSVSPGDSKDTLTPSVLFQLKVKDSQKASDVLAKIMAADTGTVTDKVQISGGQFYVDKSSGVIVGVAKDRLWLLYDADSQKVQAHLTDAIGNVGSGFGTTSEWANVKGHLARDSNIIGYVNITGVREMLETSFLTDESAKSDYEQNTAPFVKPIKYFLLGSATQDAKDGALSRNHSIFFIGISK
jgi:Protein of unknown function (DUF3352)